MNVLPIIISVPTYVSPSAVASAAATYAFMTTDYKPPQIDRAIEFDTVINQNGKFKWLYDNGPGFRKWNPFTVRCEDAFYNYLGAGATQQFANLVHVWSYRGLFGLHAPDGTYVVHWSQAAFEPQLRQYPQQSGDPVEYSVVVQFEEAS